MSVYNLSAKLLAPLTKFIANNKKKENSKRLKLNPEPELLNVQQKKAVDFVRKSFETPTPFYLIVHGVAGTGKSFVLTQIRAMLEERYGQDGYLVLAPSGVAANHIGGETIHSSLKVPVGFMNHQNVIEEDKVLWEEMEELKKKGPEAEPRLKEVEKMFSLHMAFLEKIEKLDMIIIDEFSMMSLELFGYMDLMLKQAAINSSQPFGGNSVILFGDFGQLPPVAGTPLYGSPTSDVFSMAGKEAYANFKTSVRLHENVRQIGASQEAFRQCLLHIRNGTVSQSDIDLLNTRVFENLAKEEQDKFKDAIHVFPRNLEVDKHNTKELAKLDTEKVDIRAYRPRLDSNELLEMWPMCHELAIGCKVMLMANLWTKAGLVNGACGVVESIIYEENVKQPEMPSIVNVKFENYRGPLPKGQTSVPIQPILMIGNALKGQRWKEIPLRVSYASTVHKAQSRTMDRVFVDFRHSFGFWTVMAFVALSRAKTLEGLALAAPFNLKDFGRLGDCSLNMVLEEEERLKTFEL